jgi:hypothetical protein
MAGSRALPETVRGVRFGANLHGCPAAAVTVARLLAKVRQFRPDPYLVRV